MYERLDSMNVIIKPWPETFGNKLGTPRFDHNDIKLNIKGVLKLWDQTRIKESLWLRLLGLQGTKDWAATRDPHCPHIAKRLIIGLGRDLGSYYGNNTLVVWREGNRRLCEFHYGCAKIGKFTWVIDGYPIGKIPRKPSKKPGKGAAAVVVKEGDGL